MRERKIWTEKEKDLDWVVEKERFDFREKKEQRHVKREGKKDLNWERERDERTETFVGRGRTIARAMAQEWRRLERAGIQLGQIWFNTNSLFSVDDENLFTHSCSNRIVQQERRITGDRTFGKRHLVMRRLVNWHLANRRLAERKFVIYNSAVINFCLLWLSI